MQEWNYNYGTSLSTEIQKAFDAAEAAAQRYGDFVTAIMGGISAEIDSITKQIEALDVQMSNLSTSTSSGSGAVGNTNKNTTVGAVGSGSTPSRDDQIHAAVKEMYQNAQAWYSASGNERQRLDARNLQLGAQLNNLGLDARRDDGAWYVGNDLLFEKYKKYCYHTGGFVGKEPLKPNEQFIKVENKEFVMTSNQQDSFAAQIDHILTMTKKFAQSIMDVPVSAKSMWPDVMAAGGGSTISNITNNNSSQPVEIRMGDITINAPSGNGKIIADEVRKITRGNVNDIARILGKKW